MSKAKTALLAAAAWLIPTALARALYRDDVDVVAWLAAPTVFAEHPGLYVFWCLCVYLEVAILAFHAVRRGGQLRTMAAVLALGGLANLFVSRRPRDARTQLEPWGAQLLAAPLTEFADTVVAPRLVCVWLALQDTRRLHVVPFVFLALVPTLLAILAGWIDGPVLVASLLAWRAASTARGEGKDRETQARDAFAAVHDDVRFEIGGGEEVELSTQDLGTAHSLADTAAAYAEDELP